MNWLGKKNPFALRGAEDGGREGRKRDRDASLECHRSYAENTTFRLVCGGVMRYVGR